MGVAGWVMTDRELMQMALDALAAMQTYAAAEKKGLRICDEAIEALRARLTQPKPDYSKAGFVKPRQEEGCAECGKKASKGWALYCVKCNEREWVGLTDEEILDVLHPLVMADMSDEATDYEIARAIEAKLKEKNT